MPDDEKPKRMNPTHLRRTLYWLTLDWINLHNTLPAPTGGKSQRTSNVKEFGHPAEWASDTARDIVDKMTSWHDYMAEIRGETRPRRKRMRRNTDGDDVWEWAANEQKRLVSAWRYLEPRIEQLCDTAPREALKELPDLHHSVRRVLGQWTPKYTLPIPCPSDACGLRTLIRRVGIGQDFIVCDACGYAIKETYYPLLIKMTLDVFIASNPEMVNCTDTVDAVATRVS